MNDGMYYVGLANIFKKREINIDGETQVFYEKIDTCFGFDYTFNNNGTEFVILSGKHIGQTLSTKTKEYIVGNFKTLQSLCVGNNRNYNYEVFRNKYQNNIGDYYTYDSDKNHLSLVTDQELIEKLKRANKDYDTSFLDSNIDISNMYSEIKKRIIGEDEQIKQILTSLFKNQRVINSQTDEDIIAKLKENILVYGPTGTGKTEILKRIAHISRVPIVIEDVTALSEPGYAGRSITDMLEDLYLASDKKLELAAKGILVLDNFDKLAERTNSNPGHVSRIGIQRSLLNLLAGSTFYYNDKKFDTSKLSIVALGTFNGIGDRADFVEYGITKELMGQFSKLVPMNPLTKEDMKRILVESDLSPLNTYKLLFDSMGIDYSYEEAFIDYIAEKALALNNGARSLKTVFDEAISSDMFRIFAGEYSAINLVGPTNNDTKPYILTKRK